MIVSAPDDDEVEERRTFWSGVAGSGRLAIGVISIDVDVESAPPVEALTEDEAPVADDLAESLAGLIGRNEAILMYRSFGAPANADGGEAGIIPVKEATSCEAVLDNGLLDLEGKTLGELGETSTNVVVLEVLPADVGLFLVKSVADGVLLRFNNLAVNPLWERSGSESLLGSVLVPPLFPKSEVPKTGRARPQVPPVLALFRCPNCLQLPLNQPPRLPKLNPKPPLLRPDLGSFPDSDSCSPSTASVSTLSSSSNRCLLVLSNSLPAHFFQRWYQ